MRFRNPQKLIKLGVELEPGTFCADLQDTHGTREAPGYALEKLRRSNAATATSPPRVNPHGRMPRAFLLSRASGRMRPSREKVAPGTKIGWRPTFFEQHFCGYGR